MAVNILKSLVNDLTKKELKGLVKKIEASGFKAKYGLPLISETIHIMSKDKEVVACADRQSLKKDYCIELTNINHESLKESHKKIIDIVYGAAKNDELPYSKIVYSKTNT